MASEIEKLISATKNKTLIGFGVGDDPGDNLDVDFGLVGKSPLGIETGDSDDSEDWGQFDGDDDALDIDGETDDDFDGDGDDDDFGLDGDDDDFDLDGDDDDFDEFDGI